MEASTEQRGSSPLGTATGGIASLKSADVMSVVVGIFRPGGGLAVHHLLKMKVKKMNKQHCLNAFTVTMDYLEVTPPYIKCLKNRWMKLPNIVKHLLTHIVEALPSKGEGKNVRWGGNMEKESHSQPTTEARED